MPPVVENVTSDDIVGCCRREAKRANQIHGCAKRKPNLMFPEMAEMRKKRVEEADGAA
jgi:hypothetical protein